MRDNEITLLLPRTEIELAKELTGAGINYETPARDGLAFDAGEIYAYIDLILYSVPLATVITAYIKRNAKKRVLIERRGEKIDITGYSAKEVEGILEKSKGAFIRIEDGSE
ncbi:hypothetical protein RJE46_10685 [Cedecea neteri]|uniref:hypothetical protein n=1 Tax=Cedecea neteri TaxID=158822 RepID=UPI0028931AF8|nr:hypothetical protein [Cedecea neteri]WNJ81663.1 hypothetical protein RJE46_10685 [Cedecea neteri]